MQLFSFIVTMLWGVMSIYASTVVKSGESHAMRVFQAGFGVAALIAALHIADVLP